MYGIYAAYIFCYILYIFRCVLHVDIERKLFWSSENRVQYDIVAAAAVVAAAVGRRGEKCGEYVPSKVI